MTDRLSNILTNLRAIGQLAAAASPWVPTGASSAAEVTAQWLTASIGSQHAGAVATSVKALDGTTGTTDRRRMTADWNEVGLAGGLPTNIFVKSTPLSAKNRAMVAPLDMCVNEVRFYKQLATDVAGWCPRAWYADAGIGARFLLVLDDIIHDGATPYALADTCPIEHAAGVIDVFAGLHAHFWDSPRFDADLKWVKRWSARPGNLVLKTFYSRGRRKALELGRPETTAGVRDTAAALDSNIDAYYGGFESGPLTLLHGDSHLGNTYSLPTGGAGLLDWQVIWRGPGLREVTYFIVTGLDTDLRRECERDLLERYLDGLRDAGVGDVPDFDTAFGRYRLFAAEAWDATAMTMAWPGLQAQENAEAGWRRACQAVEDLDTAAAVRALGR
jgi:hypothetical protein